MSDADLLEEALRRSDQAAAELRRDASEQFGAQEEPRVETYEVAAFETA